MYHFNHSIQAEHKTDTSVYLMDLKLYPYTNRLTP